MEPSPPTFRQPLVVRWYGVEAEPEPLTFRFHLSHPRDLTFIVHSGPELPVDGDEIGWLEVDTANIDEFVVHFERFLDGLRSDTHAQLLLTFEGPEEPQELWAIPLQGRRARLVVGPSGKLFTPGNFGHQTIESLLDRDGLADSLDRAWAEMVRWSSTAPEDDPDMEHYRRRGLA